MLNLPIRILNKIKTKLIIEYRNFKFNYKERIARQEKIYKRNNLNRLKGVKLINKILQEEDLALYDENQGMFSEHLIIFASIASKRKNNIKTILEIGTYDGITSTLLAKLFPDSKIITIDLEDNNSLFLETYNRSNYEKRNNFIKLRDQRISRYKNINFLKMNSLGMTLNLLDNETFDLIWIDGAHGYPVVCSDITNAIRLAHANTFIMCDDVWKDLKNSDPIYSSIAAWETLESFREAGIITSDYFYKRLGKKYLSSQKFISLARLI